MSDRTQVNLAVESTRKQAWKEYAEQEHRSLSELIRLAVEKEISDSSSEPEADVPDDLSGQISDMAESLRQIERDIHTLDNRLASVESKVSEDPELTELAGKVFEVLPESKTEIITSLHQDQKSEPIPPGERANTGLPSDIASVLETSERRVEQALDKLQSETHRVHSTSISGEERFYKEG